MVDPWNFAFGWAVILWNVVVILKTPKISFTILLLLFMTCVIFFVTIANTLIYLKGS